MYKLKFYCFFPFGGDVEMAQTLSDKHFLPILKFHVLTIYSKCLEERRIHPEVES